MQEIERHIHHMDIICSDVGFANFFIPEINLADILWDLKDCKSFCGQIIDAARQSTRRICCTHTEENISLFTNSLRK